MKPALLKYFLSTYSITGWPFFGMNKIRLKFGPETRDALNELYLEGWIRKRPGANVDIIELIRLE